ncbi:MAG: insulinase family protein [Betaproteobacteria bacterium]|nr:insulinase family protein [Betaproteobacteria bacterium]
MPSSRPSPFLRLLVLLAAALLALNARAALPPGITQGASVEGFTEYRLANGLRVVLYPDDTKPTTTVNVTYMVGSRQESYGETGMAHLLEHLVFKGTLKIENIFQELGRRGMRFNGTTFFDRTNYFESFTASDENLDWALAMEADRMVNALVRKSDLDTEMTVVRNEFENWENNPRSVLWGRLQAAAYDWHNYGNLTIGARSDIENVSIDRLQAFYRTWYQPDNAVLIVAGKFDPAPTLERIARYFGPIPKPARALPAIYTREPVQDGERSVTVRRVGSAQFIGALYRTPPGAHPDATALAALGEIMTIAPSGRLYQALVESRKASAVDAWNLELSDPGNLIFWAQVPLGDSADAARATMLETLYGLRDKPITQAEVDRVKTRTLTSIDEIINDPQQLGLVLSESIAVGDWRLFFIQRDRWRALTAADVQRVGLEYLKNANLTFGQFIPDAKPDRAPAPPTVDVAALVADYKGDAQVAAGEVFDPTPANLEARTQRFTLPSGMKVALLPKKTRGETVEFSLQLHHGNVASLRGLAPAGSLAASMLNRGTQQRDRQAWEDALDKYRAKLSFSGGQTGTSASGQTVRAHLADVLRLLSEALREPAFAAPEFDQLKRQLRTRIDQGRTDPQAIAQRALGRHDNPYPVGDVRYTPTFDEELARLDAATLAAAKDFHARFIGGTNAELSLVGDFDAKAMQALVEELFGNWKSPAPYARVPEPYRPTVPTVLRTETPDKANAMLIGKMALPMTDQSPDYAAMLVADQILGAGAQSRIPDRVREKEGLSYSAGSGFRASPFDDNGSIFAYAIFAPENLDRVQRGITEEIARAVRDGFTDKEVADAKQAVMQKRRLARNEDGVLGSALVTQAYLGRTWQQNAELDTALEALTASEVNAALRKYVRADGFAWAVAGDFARVKR